jgi:hypothetical protein
MKAGITFGVPLFKVECAPTVTAHVEVSPIETIEIKAISEVTKCPKPSFELLKFGNKSTAIRNALGISSDSITIKIEPDQNVAILPWPEICIGERIIAIDNRNAERIPDLLNLFENSVTAKKKIIGEIIQTGTPLAPPGLNSASQIELPPDSGRPGSNKIWVGCIINEADQGKFSASGINP